MKRWELTGSRAIMTLLSCLGLCGAPRAALACGGCFHAPSRDAETTVVTGHRMAFAVSAERTVLWDQIQYQGAPEDFSWVLPVLPGAFIETSTDAWFETLETVTQTQVTSPQLTCATSGGSGCSCGAGMSASDGASARSGGFDDGSQVVVVHKGTIGPYETVTLRSTDGDALTEWLEGNGYFVPADIAPIIAAYVGEGSDFIALRLKPGAGVQQMQPVRVVTPNGAGLLPLRMVAAGTGASVEIVLYGIAEERLSMPDLHEVSVDTKQLVWDFAGTTSNYGELRRQALARNLGFSTLTSFADRGAFSKQYSAPDGGLIGYQVSGSTGQFGVPAFNNFADLYFAQASANSPVPRTCPSIVGSLGGDDLIAPASASAFACGDFSDISAAMVGMHPARVWLTRFELELPREALSQDCVVVASESQTAVSNQLVATKFTNPPSTCAQPVFESRLASGSPSRVNVWLSVLAVMALHGLRRRARRAGL